MHCLRLVVATAAMCLAVHAVTPDDTLWLDWGWQRRALELAQLCALGMGVYVLAQLLLGARPRHLRAPENA